MKCRRMVLRVGMLLTMLLGVSMPLAAADVPPPELQITQLNITGEEYVTIQNSGSTSLDLANYWLGYDGSDSATAVPSQQLPDETLQPGQAVMLSNGAAATCGAVAVDDLAFSLGNSTGTLALWRLDTGSGMPSFGYLGGVAWGKQAAAPAYLHIADEANVTKYNAVDANPTWLNGSGTWRVGDMQDCAFTPVVSATVADPVQDVSWLVSGETPPFTVLPAVSTGGDSAGGSIPASDIGLKALVLSEILPNPGSPQTDAADEFIELYNPNDKPFDVSGFKLQIASATSATTHSYTIPAATTIAAKGFKAFMSADTHLGMNNSGGEVWFVDPLDHTVADSGVYGTAKDGQAWINTGGKWQWTLTPTPGAANKLSAAAGSSGSKSASVNGHSITGVAGNSAVAGASTTASQPAANVVPLHPATLAVVICLALLYLAYEYRHDLANYYDRFRSHRGARS